MAISSLPLFFPTLLLLTVQSCTCIDILYMEHKAYMCILVYVEFLNWTALHLRNYYTYKYVRSHLWYLPY